MFKGLTGNGGLSAKDSKNDSPGGDGVNRQNPPFKSLKTSISHSSRGKMTQNELPVSRAAYHSAYDPVGMIGCRPSTQLLIPIETERSDHRVVALK